MAQPTATTAPGTSPPGLAGREREWARLRAHLAAALAGRGGLVLLGGEAGIGKTALAEALGQEAEERGALVLVGRCYDLTETPPYGPWLDLAGRYPAPAADLSPPPGAADDRAGGGGRPAPAELPPLPPLPPVLARRGDPGEGAGREAPAAEIERFLAAVAARRPLLVLLDDLHWADPASLDLLRRLGREADRLPLLLVATYRTEEVARPHPLHAVLPLLVREARADRLELRPLPDADLRALVAARYALPADELERLVAWVQARAEGNPFYAGELLRALEEERVLRPAPHPAGRPADGARRDDERAPRPSAGERWELGDPAEVGLPPLLRQVLDRRLARLAEDERGLLAVAATIGQEVPLALWAAVGLIEEGALLDVIELGVAANVLEVPADGASVRFAHPLIRQALYEGLLPPRRRVWHRRVAEALLALPSPDPDAVAGHFRRAGDARAAEWLVRAGERAQRAYAWLTAAERFEAALALLEGAEVDGRVRATLLVALAQLRRYTAPERGVGQLEEAERLARAAGDRALAASALFDRGHLRCLAR
ncbi:MAG TPA: AAA family ATPase, partial [Vicinamibacteria bacterium]